MCGRFALHTDLSALRRMLAVQVATVESAPRYNIAPSQEILAVIQKDMRRLVKLHWGLVPFWSRDKSKAFRMINARAETAAEKPSFRSAFKERRCLIPADGYFEWRRDDIFLCRR